RLTGMASSLIAPPFHRSTRSACPPSWSRCTVMFTSSSRVRSSCLRSLPAVDGASQTACRSSPSARIAARSAAVRVAGRAAWRRHGLRRGQERAGDGLVDGHAAGAQVPGAAALDQLAGAGAVIAGGGLVLALVVDGELAAADTAGGQPLQQRAALADRAGAGLMRHRADVLPDPGLVGLV